MNSQSESMANDGVPKSVTENVQAPVVETFDLTRRFDKLTAVDSVSLTVNAAEIFGLIGPNGAGKSTLIKMLTTMLPPSSGRGLVAAFDVAEQPAQVRRRIGYVPQLPSADGELTGYENLLLSSPRIRSATPRRRSRGISGGSRCGLRP
jgi:ABC-2 type transport system ATP-binding protein